MPDDTTDADTAGERRMTTDIERIREWAERNDAVPVSTHGGDGHGHGHTLAHRDNLGDDADERSWEEFAEIIETEELVLVYEESADDESDAGIGHFELLERDVAFDRADLGREAFDDALRQGETVTTEIVETQVVEREVVERDTIESEVVETELAERTVVDSELLKRAIVDTEFVAEDVIEVVTEEQRLETVEEIERYTVESRVVDVDVEHHDELERDEIETGVEPADVELETVQRSILESDVIRSDVRPDDVLAAESVQSKRTEGDVIQTDLLERRTVEDRIEERTRRRFALEVREVVESDLVESDLIEGEIIDVEEYEPIEASGDTETTTSAETERGDRAGPMTGTERSVQDETTVGAEAGAGATTIELSSEDEGKDVVDETGEQIGIVATVQGDTAYVDPQPGVTDRLKARLGWGDHGGDDYPIEAAQIADVTDDEVVVRGSGAETGTGTGTDAGR